MSAVIGFAADLDAVERLFTSLPGAGIGGTGTNVGWKDSSTPKSDDGLAAGCAMPRDRSARRAPPLP